VYSKSKDLGRINSWAPTVAAEYNASWRLAAGRCFVNRPDYVRARGGLYAERALGREQAWAGGAILYRGALYAGMPSAVHWVCVSQCESV
jgi:hypothetical protein